MANVNDLFRGLIAALEAEPGVLAIIGTTGRISQGWSPLERDTSGSPFIAILELGNRDDTTDQPHGTGRFSGAFDIRIYGRDPDQLRTLEVAVKKAIPKAATFVTGWTNTVFRSAGSESLNETDTGWRQRLIEATVRAVPGT